MTLGSEASMFVKLTILVIVLLIAVLVGVRNIRRDFRPPVQARAELFLTGVAFGVVLMSVIIPDTKALIVFGSIAAVLTGFAYAYSLPRQWRFWNDMNSK